MPIALLPDRAIVTVTGEPATEFLQGILTCNVESIPRGEARLGALLTPQGKIQFDFLISRAGRNGYRIDVASERAPDLVKRLTLYKLRAKVTIATDPTLGIGAAWDEAETSAKTVRLRDGRLPQLGERLYFTQGAFSADATEQDYHTHRIALGIPEGGRDFAFGDAFPHEALMDQLGGVDFRKGCYVGQEVVSRMQHRGTARTRILSVTYPDGDAAPLDTEITAAERSLGRTGSAAGRHGLAMIRIDRLGEAMAAGQPILVDGRAVEIAKPPFATFAILAGAAVG